VECLLGYNTLYCFCIVYSNKNNVASIFNYNTLYCIQYVILHVNGLFHSLNGTFLSGQTPSPPAL